MKNLIVLALTIALFSPAIVCAAEDGTAGAEATTVKSTKSNTSDRARGAAAESATTVKSGKSNSSERAEGSAADSAATVKGSKSNTSE
jgi:hypothetical protein